ncbi:MAG: hypothetical protein IJD60_13160 [Clostridia bacterium]|nr:hypothetical protein [Clostridia bacterium]
MRLLNIKASVKVDTAIIPETGALWQSPKTKALIIKILDKTGVIIYHEKWLRKIVAKLYEAIEDKYRDDSMQARSECDEQRAGQRKGEDACGADDGGGGGEPAAL